MIQKKGVSAIVATILLIVLTLALGVIIATVAIPFVRNSLASSTECSSYKNYFTFDSSFNLNCYDISGTAAKVSVKAAQISPDAAAKVKGFQLVFIREGGSSESVSILDRSTSSCAAGEVVDYDTVCPGFGMLTLPQVGEARSYRYFSKSDIQGYALVNPVLTSGRTCDTSDRIKLSLCSSS